MISTRFALLLALPLVAAMLLIGFEVFPPAERPASWIVQLHGVARVEDGAVAFVIPSAEPLVGVAVDTRHGQLWVARRNSLEIHALTGERLVTLDLPGVRQIHALGYDRGRDEVWVAADDAVRRYGPNGAQKSRVRL